MAGGVGELERSSYTESMGEDSAGKLIGWSLGSVTDSAGPRPFDTLSFPCVFRFKAIGHTAADLVIGMLERVATLMGRAIDQSEWSVRESGGGKYTSLTLDLQVTSGQQVYDIYAALKADARVTHLL